jgi:hypothetical protein
VSEPVAKPLRKNRCADKREGQCCCKCRHHLSVNHHCTTSTRGTGCVCSVRKGWACVPPGWGVAYDNWPKHSIGCEMFERMAKKEEAERA